MNEAHGPLEGIDAVAFAKDVDRIRAGAEAAISPADLRHLRRIEAYGRISTALGYGTAWLGLNPISPLLISLGIFNRWIVAHHVCHQGYDRVPGAPKRYHSRRFAKGWRRYVDWCDWFDPDAWAYEHNVLHHYRTGELQDPDLVERNLVFLRESPLPLLARYALIVFGAMTWKFTYYAPNTLLHQRGQPDRETGFANVLAAFNPLGDPGRRLWLSCFYPYIAIRFLLIPSLFLPLGRPAALAVLLNSLLAELITNVHSFVMIVPNHAGEDLYRFSKPAEGRPEFLVRQVIGSTNYTTGGNLNDFLHGWLNYQIEHHLWPDLPMSQYQRLQPALRELCAKYGIPYVQQSVFARLRALVRIMVGQGSMRVARGSGRLRDLTEFR